MNRGGSISKDEGKKLLYENIAILRKNITRLLKENNVSKSELGLQIDKDRYYIDYVMNDSLPNPSLDGLGKIAFALNTTIPNLFS